MLTVDGLSVSLSGRGILRDVRFTARAGRVLMIVGPNGAGKSTLISAISQSVRYAGSVRFEGEDVARLSSVERAKRMGVLAQRHSADYAFTVGEVVRLGRYAYQSGALPSHTEADERAVRDALAKTGLLGMEERSVLTLSGGELQRVFLSQTIAQNPRLMLLDEPANHLDIAYQKQVFTLMRQWLSDSRAVIAVSHDLSLAMAYGDDALLLCDGQVAGFSTVKDVLSRDNLARVYGLDVHQWMRGLLSCWEE